MKHKKDTSKKPEVIFPHCHYCGTEITTLPFRCRKCKSQFCEKHHHPEYHECPGLLQFQKKSTLPEIISNLKETDSTKRKDAAQQLKKRTWNPPSNSEKIQFLFADQRWDDLISFGNDSLRTLHSGLMDNESHIRACCARSLGKIKNRQSIDFLIKSITDSDCRVRNEVAVALENLGWIPKDEKEKIDFFIAKQEWEEIIKIGDNAIDPVSVFCADTNEEIRFQAISALSKFHSDRIIDPLTKALEDSSLKIKHAALSGLLKIRNVKTLHGLLIALKDPEPEVRKIAFDGIVCLDFVVVPQLMDSLSAELKKIDALKNPEENPSDLLFISYLCLALGEIQDIRSRDQLITIATTRKINMVKESANMAIRKIDEQLNNLKKKKNLYCLTCYSKFFKQKPSILPVFSSAFFPTCRKCKGNKNYLENVKKIILFLANPNEPNQFKKNILHLNWFRIKKPLDMDEIAIISATNEDIAELVMKLMNDDDFERKKNYKHTPVFIAHDLTFSQVKINLLKNSFGNIQVVKRDTLNLSGE